MFKKCNLLRHLFADLPNEGKGIYPPCFVSFPNMRQFPKSVSVRKFSLAFAHVQGVTILMDTEFADS